MEEYAGFIYESEIGFMSRSTLDCMNMETGGDLFGYYTHSGLPVIQYVIGPGKEAYRTTSFFKQDINYLEKVGAKLNEHHGLQHLGNWHSHHQLGLPRPSGHDSETMFKAIEDNALKRFTLIICSIEEGHTVINGFEYFEDGTYHQLKWLIMPGSSPIRSGEKKFLGKNLIYTPKTKKAKITKLKTTSRLESKPSHIPIPYDKSIWYTSEEGKHYLKSIYSNILELYDKSDFKMFHYDDSIELKIATKQETIKIKFPNSFPCEKHSIMVEQDSINELDNILGKNIETSWTLQD